MLNYKADRRTLAVVALYFISVGVAWFYFPSQWYFRLLIVAWLCLLSFMCAVIVHNTIHHPIFKSKQANKVFQFVLSLTYGHPVSAFVSGHNLSHHHHTQHSRDLIRTTRMKFKWNFLNQLLLFFQNAPYIMREEAQFIKKIKEVRPKWYRQYNIEKAGVFVFRLGLLILNWKLGLLLIFIPHIYAAWGIVGTNFWQHYGCDRDHPYNHSRNFTNKILNFVAFNNGYHTLHHNEPHLHWSLLPEYHEKEIVPHLHPNLNRKYLTVYLWEALIWPGKRLDYLGNPVVIDPNEKYINWVDEVDFNEHAKQYKNQLGVES